MNQIGTVRWSDFKKSCGFIVPDDHSKNIFIHISQLKKLGINELEEGQRVSFELSDANMETFLLPIPQISLI